MKRAIIIGVVLVAIVAVFGFLWTKRGVTSPADKTQFKISKTELGRVIERFTFDVRAGGEVLHLANARQPSTLFNDLLNGTVIAPGHDGHAGPMRVGRLPDRNGLDIEAARAEQADDARKLARLVGNDNGKSVTHGFVDFRLPIADLVFLSGN